MYHFPLPYLSHTPFFLPYDDEMMSKRYAVQYNTVHHTTLLAKYFESAYYAEFRSEGKIASAPPDENEVYIYVPVGNNR